MKRAFTLFVKTGPACNAGCISCPSGRKGKGETEQVPLMTLRAWQSILDHILTQAKVVSAVLHYYNEPTLNPYMPGIVEYTRLKGVNTLMSTNGTRAENLILCLEAGLQNLIFSVSGFTQSIHERSHKNTDIEYIKRLMVKVSKTAKKGQFIRVGWHDYHYNRHELPLMREFACQLGFKFTPYQTSLLPLNLALERLFELQTDPDSPEHPGERDLVTKMKEAKQLCLDRRHFTCIYQHRMIAVDGNGNLSNCPAKAVADNLRESVFAIPLEAFNSRRLTEPDCIKCKSVGGHVYGMQKYRSPLTLRASFARHCEDLYRLSGIGGYLHFIPKLINRWSYERPDKDI